MNGFSSIEVELHNMGAHVDSCGRVLTIVKDSTFHKSQLLYPGFIYVDKTKYPMRTDYYFCRKAPENLPRGFAIPHAIKDDIIRMSAEQKEKMQSLFDARPIIRPNNAHTLQRVSVFLIYP